MARDLTSRQQDVFDHLDEVTDIRPAGAFRVPGGYWLHGFPCTDQIKALIKKGVIKADGRNGKLFKRCAEKTL